MRISSPKVLLSMTVVAFAVSGWSGCAQPRFKLLDAKRQTGSKQCGDFGTPVEPQPRHGLRVIEFPMRRPIILSDIGDEIMGRPLADRPLTVIRDLTILECRALAATASPVARQLESHRDWLLKLQRTPVAIANALTLQAKYERSLHTTRALETYLQLTEVHAQPPIVDKTTAILVEAESTLAKFRAADIDVPADPGELQRRRFVVAEQVSELRLNQNRLNDGLEALLQLATDPSVPIWTPFEAPVRAPEPAEPAAVIQAYAQRGDLLALEQLTNDARCLSADSLATVLSSMQPLAGSAPALPGPAKWWQCALRDEIECLKKLERSERQRQLLELVTAKRDQIRLEVREHLHALRHHRELLNLKLERLNSLRASLESAARAKDERPVDFQQRLEQRSEELRLTSEIIHESLAIEIERVRLDQAMGQDETGNLPSSSSR